jgi:hypothetical protein
MNEVMKADKEITETIRNNLKLLMNIYGLKTSRFCDYLENNGEKSLDRTTFSRFMGGQVARANIAFLVSCCHVFNLSMDNLISDEFNPYENAEKFRKQYRNAISDDVTWRFDSDWQGSEIFIENPASPLLEKYIQTYHCYYHSTVSSENNTNNIQESLISGTLDIKADGKRCKAILKIDTKKLNSDGTPDFKIYSGYVIFCPSVQSVNCILTLPEGEFCFIIFRYSHLNQNKQECRLAEVLSTSSKLDKRCPVIHRMLLSNKEIQKKDMELIAPHLWLNSSEILLDDKKLSELSKLSEKYDQIVKTIMENNLERIYCVDEITVEKIATKYLKAEDLPMFITRLRACSLSKRYNKINSIADQRIHDLLSQRDYFHSPSSQC